jgi:predicted MFS family arabinose efflux permease
MKGKSILVLLILACLNFTHILDFMIMMPLGNYLMPYFHITAQQFSFLVAAYTLSAAASGFAAAFFVDGFDRKQVLLLGYIGFLAGTVACGFAPSYPWLFAARIFAGIFGGLIGAQVLAIASDMFPYEQRGKAMGTIMSSFAIASTLGVPFALYLANHFSWHAPFLLVGGLGAIVVPLIIKFIPSMTDHLRKRQEGENRFHALLNVVRQPQLRLALLFSGLIMMGHFLIIPFINPFLEFNKGFSKAQTPMIYLAGGAASFLAANVLGWLADKYGKLPVFSICVVFSLFLVYIITNLPAWSFAIVVVFFVMWFVASTGRNVTSQAMISNVVSAEHRGSFMSFNSCVQQLGTGVASLVAGAVVVADSNGKVHHYNWLGYGSIVITFVCVLLAWYLFGRMDRKLIVSREA